MLYSYTARDEQGNLESGELEAPSKESLAQQLKTKGLLLTSASTKSTEEKQIDVNNILEKLKRIGTVPLEEKMFFTQNLQIMLHSGISLSVALKTLVKQTKNAKFAYALGDIQTSVEKGTSFAESLRQHKKIFGDLFVNMVDAGEQSGQLEETLLQLRIQMKKDHDLISKIKGAMTYPTIVVIAMVGVMITVVTFVIPKITELFTETSVELPLPTRVLIAVSDFTVSNGPILAVAVILLIIGFFKFIKTKSGKKIWNKILLKSPIVATIIKKINIARFCRTISSLLKTDIPIVKSFHITSSTLGNYYYQKIVEDAAQSLKKGISVTDALKEDESLFPPIVLQMISVGEESGSLDTILENLAQFYEEQVTEVMNNFSSIIEPVLILLLGLGVGAIAVAVIMPIYTLTQNI